MRSLPSSDHGQFCALGWMWGMCCQDSNSRSSPDDGANAFPLCHSGALTCITSETDVADAGSSCTIINL